jgi:hypothetical protein
MTFEETKKQVQDEWIGMIHSTDQNVDMDALRTGINYLYEKAGFKPPNISIWPSPKAAAEQARILLNDPNATDLFCTYGDKSDYGWVSYYDLLVRTNSDELNNFDEETKKGADHYLIMLKAGYSTMIQLDEECLVVRNPQIAKYENQRLHSVDGPALSWDNGADCVYAVNGRIIDADVFTEPVTREKFINETNAERKAAMYARLGPDKTLELLGATVIDERILVHKDGRPDPIKLLKTTEVDKVVGDKLAWVQMVCPSTGTVYAIDCDPSHTDVLDAHASLSILDKALMLEGYTQHS